MNRIELRDGGILEIYPSFLDMATANDCFYEFRESIEWSQKPGPFGTLQPRLTAAYGASGLNYRYSGTENLALPWTVRLQSLKDQIEELGSHYNFCLLNRYRTGQDSVGWHADDERGMGPTIASLSLGATRLFRIRHNQTREIQSFQLTSGLLLVMAGTMQQHWKHEVPKSRLPIGERINLTFRWIDRS